VNLPFELRTPVGPGNHVLHEGPDPPMRRDNFEEENGRLIVKYRDTLRSSVQKTTEHAAWVVGSDGRKESCAVLGSRPPSNGKGQFWGKRAPIVQNRDNLRSPVR